MVASGRVLAVHRDAEHRFSKLGVDEIELVAGLGVVGDAHSGATVRHRSRVARDPDQPNLRQVHLVASVVFDFVEPLGFEVGPGDMGENITTEGVELLDLPTGAVLSVGGDGVLLGLTGFRNPCGQINRFSNGLLNAVKQRGAEVSARGNVGPMSVVLHGGTVRAGDLISIALPPLPHMPLARV